MKLFFVRPNLGFRYRENIKTNHFITWYLVNAQCECFYSFFFVLVKEGGKMNLLFFKFDAVDLNNNRQWLVINITYEFSSGQIFTHQKLWKTSWVKMKEIKKNERYKYQICTYFVHCMFAMCTLISTLKLENSSVYLLLKGT